MAVTSPDGSFTYEDETLKSLLELRNRPDGADVSALLAAGVVELPHEGAECRILPPHDAVVEVLRLPALLVAATRRSVEGPRGAVYYVTADSSVEVRPLEGGTHEVTLFGTSALMDRIAAFVQLHASKPPAGTGFLSSLEDMGLFGPRDSGSVASPVSLSRVQTFFFDGTGNLVGDSTRWIEDEDGAFWLVEPAGDRAPDKSEGVGDLVSVLPVSGGAIADAILSCLPGPDDRVT